MSDQSALTVVADNQHLSLALGGLHQQIFTAAEENLRATLGGDWEA